ncbi:pleckstrin homology domain-containing family O member 1-like [Rhincodon typus]|uniref:pleckstrin homology domain-containing family O member 1-like n=1 Tax=Rhincodon typus TaxID=259920 RepID=UPI00202E30DA|nr:pleckstrin homology domain-containing family O member 1-like [Rhincodon typus]
MGEDGGSPGRTGWVRKQCGRSLLGSSWKERFIRLQRGRLLIFQQQDDAQYEEMVELGKYQRCQEIRGFMKRNQFRLVLVRRSGTKVPELKFQINDAEEKDSWLSALNEAIGEANNKEFDQVTVDEKCSLDHLTRNRAKINHTRRPPTRQHRKEVASAVSSGIQRLELGAQTLIIEKSTDEAQLKEKASNQVNKNRPVLMPKARHTNAKSNDGLEMKKEGPVTEEGEGPSTQEPLDQAGEGPLAEKEEGPPAEKGAGPPAEKGAGPPAEKGAGPPAEKGAGPPAEVGEGPPAKEGESLPTKKEEGPPAEQGEGPPAEQGEGPPAEKGESGKLSCTRVLVSDLFKNEGESDFQTRASADTSEMEKQRSETNSNSSLNRTNLSWVKCASLGDILSESKRQGIRKQFDTYGNLKNTQVEKMESGIAFELKATKELLQQVSRKEAAVEQPLQSNTSQDSWSTRSAARLLNDAMATWSEADKVLQELKDLKELYKKPATLTSEERERRKNLLTFYRRSVP